MRGGLNKCNDVNLHESVDPSDLPDGRYPAIWGGYVVTFRVEGRNYQATTELGIRTPRFETWVVIDGGKVSVEG